MRARVALLELSSGADGPTKRAFFEGRAHPVFHPASPLTLGGREWVLFDGAAFWAHGLLGASSEARLPELARALGLARAVLLVTEDLGEATASLLRAARCAGVARLLVARTDARDASTAAALPLTATDGAWANVAQLEGALDDGAACRCHGPECAACRAWRELQAAIAGVGDPSTEAVVAPRPWAGAVARAVAHGATGADLRVFVDAPSSFVPGAPIDLLTERARASSVVRARFDDGLLLERRGVTAASVLGVAAPGAGAVSTELRLRPTAAATLPTRSARLSLFSAGLSFGPCQLSVPQGEGAWLVRCPRPVVVAPGGPCFLVSTEPGPASPIRLWAGSSVEERPVRSTEARRAR